MNLLFDQNLSRFLVDRVSDAFKGSLHVVQLGLDRASDREIWEWAGANGFTIVSKDSDFRGLATTSGPPPKAIWIRVGNATTDEIGRLLDANSQRMRAFDLQPDESLLIIERDD